MAERYAAFLRGINMGGKNILSMPALEEAFSGLGFADVATVLNSGNVLFSAERTDTEVLRSRISGMIREVFGLNTSVFVGELETIRGILSLAPDWWGTDDRGVYDNLVFILSGESAEEICAQLGDPSEGLERVMPCGSAIFWSYDLANYQKSRWWKKTASKGVAEKLTIRTANTVRRVCRQ